MTKKYTARSHVALTIYLADGGRKHVSFSQLTGGGSVYITNDEAEQKALERHPSFGKLFRIDAAFAAAQKLPTFGASVKAPKVEAQAPAAPKIQKVHMPSLADAKEYIADNFGVSRSKLRTKASIEAEALKHNIEFEGI